MFRMIKLRKTFVFIIFTYIYCFKYISNLNKRLLGYKSESLGSCVTETFMIIEPTYKFYSLFYSKSFQNLVACIYLFHLFLEF